MYGGSETTWLDELQRDVALVGQTCAPMKLPELVHTVFKLGQRYWWLLSHLLAALGRVLDLRISGASKHADPVKKAASSGVEGKDEDTLDRWVTGEAASGKIAFSAGHLCTSAIKLGVCQGFSLWRRLVGVCRRHWLAGSLRATTSSAMLWTEAGSAAVHGARVSTFGSTLPNSFFRRSHGFVEFHAVERIGSNCLNFF